MKSDLEGSHFLQYDLYLIALPQFLPEILRVQLCLMLYKHYFLLIQ